MSSTILLESVREFAPYFGIVFAIAVIFILVGLIIKFKQEDEVGK